MERRAARRIWPNVRANSAKPSAALWEFACATDATPPQASPPSGVYGRKSTARNWRRFCCQFKRSGAGPAPQNELIALEGKEPKHGGAQSVLSAVCVPSQYYLASAMVVTKTHEIPVAQKLFADLDLKGRFVSRDALHTQTQTARDIVLGGEETIC